MKNKTICIILIIIGLMLIIGAPTFVYIHEEEIHYEAPCVDGEGDLNLEGIMCDKVEYSLFGVGGVWILLIVFVPITSGLILFMVGYNLFKDCSEED